jgi:hypothetical protein
MSDRSTRQTPEDPVRLFVLATSHETMRAEDVLREKGIRCRTIPKPRVVQADCGLALVCPPGLGDSARSALAGVGVEPVADMLYVPRKGVLFKDG